MTTIWLLFKLGISITKKTDERVVISVTSYPARFSYLSKTLKTLITQTTKAHSIRVYIEGKDFHSLDSSLLELRKFGVEFCPTPSGWRAATKLIPEALREEVGQELILYLDDEIVYDCQLVENLLYSYEKNPEFDVIFNWGHIVPSWDSEQDCLPSYSNWITTDVEPSSNSSIVPLGVAGVLIKRGSIPLEIANLEQFKSVSNDDLWFWCHFVQKGLLMKKSLIDCKPPVYWKGSQEYALWKTNVTQGENDNILKRLFNEFPRLRDLVKESKT
jgi:hypothetical protein